MVEFLLAIGSFGMLHQRPKDAVRRRRHGDGKRWRLFCRGLSIASQCSGSISPNGKSGINSAGQHLRVSVARFPARIAIVIAIWTSIAILRAESDEPDGDASLELSAPVIVDARPAGQPSGSKSTPSRPSMVSEAQARASVQWLADFALRKMPRRFDGDKDWGNTKKLWAGVKVRRDGFKLKTHRRWREVEQGRWIKYEVTIPNATAANTASVAIHDVTPYIDPGSGDQRWKIYSSTVAPMKFTARIQRWNLGVRLFSMTITGDLQVRMISTMSVGFITDYSEIPPAMVIDPRVDQAQLILERFEVDRISGIGGDVAEQWGELIQEVLVERFVKKQSDRLVGKLNRSIEKERDELRISMAEWFRNW